MVGRVFISCGQGSPRERKIAEKIRELLEDKDKFNLKGYLAFKIQGLNDIMNITEELRASDYYLFIDFHRKKKFIEFLRRKESLPCSLFTHQELALAQHLEFKEIIAFRERGAPLEGFLRYLQANPETFKDEKDLLNKVEKAVRQRGWNKNYSRNLILAGIEVVPKTPADVLTYSDHHNAQHREYIWHAKIENRRPDAAAFNTICILESIESADRTETESNDRNPLKWVGRVAAYETTILPKDSVEVDIFAIHADEEGIYLHSALDLNPRKAILKNDGSYKLHYKLFSKGFPLLYFSVEVNYRHSPAVGSEWKNLSEAKICTPTQ
jgi:hypothetical protein